MNKLVFQDVESFLLATEDAALFEARLRDVFGNDYNTIAKKAAFSIDPDAVLLGGLEVSPNEPLFAKS